MAMGGMYQEARIDQGVDKKDGSRNESGMPRASRRAHSSLGQTNGEPEPVTASALLLTNKGQTNASRSFN
jgi:hypothetical protein